MLYRIEIPQNIAWDENEKEKLRWFGPTGAVAYKGPGPAAELICPKFRSKKAKFYFTQKGWSNIGRHVAAQLKQLGIVHRVIKRRDREVSVVYRDAMQVAGILKKEKK
jgi:hypothetical protein